jgi:hypothetical protein
MKYLPVLGVLAVVSAAASTGRAAEGDASALIARGLELRREGKSTEALDLLERAFALAPSPRTAGHVGLAEASVGRWLDAEKHLDSALAVGDDGWVRKNEALLEEAMERAHSHVGRVTFTGPAGTRVSIAGATIGALPLAAPVRVAEGVVLVAATAPGVDPVMKAVTVPGGGSVELAIEMKPVTRLAAETPDRQLESPQLVEATRPPWQKWTAAALLTVGGSAMALGAFGVVSDRWECCTEKRTAVWTLLGGGAALAGVGGVLLLTSPRHGGQMALVVLPSTIGLLGQF